jgi:hypothetical protein
MGQASFAKGDRVVVRFTDGVRAAGTVLWSRTERPHWIGDPIRVVCVAVDGRAYGHPADGTLFAADRVAPLEAT